MLTSHKAFKVTLVGLLLFCVVPIPTRTFAQERFQETTPGHFTLELGIKFLERDITEDPGAISLGTSTPALPTSTRLLAKLAVDLTPNLQIYGLIGGSDLRVDEFDGYSSDFGTAYGGGLRITVYPETFRVPVKLFFDGSFLRFHVEDTITPAFGPRAGLLTDDKITWNEGVLKIGVAGRHDFFEPYGGVRFSIVRGQERLTGSETLDFNEDFVFGIFAGSDIYLDRSRQTAMFVEANIIDENSIAGGVKVRF